MIHSITVNASPLSSTGTRSSGRSRNSIVNQIHPVTLISPEALSQNASLPPQTARMPNYGGNGNGRPRLVHSRPPLRFDRTFLQYPANQLKLVQLFCGLFALVLTIQCWPNRWAAYCVGYLWDFWQLFNAVCVHGFFLVGTSCLAVAHLFSVPDAFYHYNFPLLEKFYTALASVMYLLGSCSSLANLAGASFLLLWLFPVGATLAGFLAYSTDFWIRYRRDREERTKMQKEATQNHQPYIT